MAGLNLSLVQERRDPKGWKPLEQVGPGAREVRGLLALLLLAACADGVTTSVAPPQPGPPSEALAVLSCTAQVHAATATCEPYEPAAGVQANRIIGRQGVNVRLASTNLAYNAADSVFSMDVTVQNLLMQRMGTDDGVVTDGVYVFFYSGPFASNGAVEVHNPDGRAFFTSGDQPYYLWPEVLAQNAVSQTKRWEFKVPPQVASFRFYVYLQTPLLPVVLFGRRVDGNRNIWRVALDGSDLVRMTTHVAEDYSPTAGGGIMVFQRGWSQYSGGVLYSMPLVGGTPTRLTDYAAEPALTPDGTRLAYTRYSSGVVDGEEVFYTKVVTANPDGTGRARATPYNFGDFWDSESSPAWHPQGNRLALKARWSLYDVTLGGWPIHLSTWPAEGYTPAWSPDGAYVAYSGIVYATGSYIYMVRVADGSTTRLTFGAQWDSSPAWTSDRRIVYVESAPGGVTQLRWLDPRVPGSGGVIPGTGGTHTRPHAVPF